MTATRRVFTHQCMHSVVKVTSRHSFILFRPSFYFKGWVGDQLTGWRGSSQRPNLKINGLNFYYFFDLSDPYWDICKKTVFGDQLTGWGGSSQTQISKVNGFSFLIFLIWATDTEISVKKQCLATGWMSWGPVDWVGRVLPEAKLENNWTLLFIFLFERPILRFL